MFILRATEIRAIFIYLFTYSLALSVYFVIGIVLQTAHKIPSSK